MVYPHKWSPVRCRSSVGQGKFAGQRPKFYHCATQSTKDHCVLDEDCVRRRSNSPQGNGQFGGLFDQIKSIGSICCDVRKNGLTDRDAVWGPDSHGPKKSFYQLVVKVGRIHSPPRGVTRRRWVLSSKFFDHLLFVE